MGVKRFKLKGFEPYNNKWGDDDRAKQSLRAFVFGVSDEAKLTKLHVPATGREISFNHGIDDIDTVRLIINPYGRMAAFINDDLLQLWDTKSGHLTVEREGLCTEVVDFSPNGRMFAAGFADGTFVLWDAETGREVRTLRINSDLGPIISEGPCSFSDWFDFAFSPDSKTFFGYQIITALNSGRLWNVETGDSIWSIEELQEKLMMYLGRDELYGISFSPSGRYLVFNKALMRMIVRSSDGEVVLRSGGNSFFNEDENVVATLPTTYSDKLPDGPTLLENVEDGNDDKIVEIPFNRDLQTNLGGFRFMPDGRTVASLQRGALLISALSTGESRAEFVAFKDNSWIVSTSEGFFNASTGGAKHLSLVRGLQNLSIDQTYDALYRPDLVRETLVGDPDGKVSAAGKLLDLDRLMASGMPPRVVALRSTVGHTVEGESTELLAEVAVRSGGIGRIEWRVNGTVQGVENSELSRIRSQSDIAERLERRVFLAPGGNVVSVIVYNEANLIASDPVEIVVTSIRAKVSPPKLHVLAVGVNDYFDSQLALNYATTDARAIGQALKRAGPGLYESVEVTYLLDREVSMEGLASAFEQLGREVRPQDVFVFFLAGHGKTVDGRYYFLLRDFRYHDIEDLKKTSISQDQLQSWVAQVSAQKSVLLLDTCESGSLTNEAVPRGLARKTAIGRLARAVGRTILTASTDTQPALEGFRQHGLFTYTLLEAFARADTDGDDKVEINELIGYVDERLPELSETVFGYRQVPQYKSRGNNFPLGRTIELVSQVGRLIPRKPTHVVIREAAVYKERDDSESGTDTFMPGVMVRVIEHSDDWAQIAIDGVAIGWIEFSGLATLKNLLPGTSMPN